MALTNNERQFIQAVEQGESTFQFPPKRDVLGLIGTVISWVESQDTQFTLSCPTPAADALSAVATVTVGSATAADPFNQSASVKVSITGGNAAGRVLIGPVPAETLVSVPTDKQAVTQPEWQENAASSGQHLVLTMQDGVAHFTVSATAAGTVILGLSQPTPSGLAVISTLTVTFS